MFSWIVRNDKLAVKIPHISLRSESKFKGAAKRNISVFFFGINPKTTMT